MGTQRRPRRSLLRVEPTAEARSWLLAEYDGPVDEAAVAQRHPRWTDEDVRAKVEALRSAGPDVVIGTLRDLGGIDLWPALRDISVPTLLVGADPAEGGLVTPETGKAAATAHVRYVMIPASSHSIHRDSYEAFWAELVPFLRHVDPPARH